MRNNPFLKMEDDRVNELIEQARGRMVRHQKELESWFDRQYPNASRPSFQCIKGTACDVIPKFARDKAVDLLIMGTLATVDTPGLLIGSSAESILGDINCSVFAAKPSGFRSPVIAQ